MVTDAEQNNIDHDKLKGHLDSLQAHHKTLAHRVDKVEDTTTRTEHKVDKNTETITIIKHDTTDIIDGVNALRWLGRAVSWVGGLSAAGLVIYQMLWAP